MVLNEPGFATSRRRLLISPACLAAALICAPSAKAGQARVSGNVSYRERIALPPGYVVRVELLDISRQDAPSTPIAAVELTPPHQVPVAFELAYDEARIDPRFTYAVRASILVGGRLMFASAQNHLVITNGHPNNADLWLQRVSERKAEEKPAPPALAGEWRVEDIGGRGVLDDLQSTLRFGANGAASGHGGCNNFNGSFVSSGAKLRFGPLAVTMMASIPAIADHEKKYFAALAAVRTARIEGGVLFLADANGAPLVKLTRP
ncbi:putative lipoprotein [Methylocapsa palsarum]|uniref:Putative lipoprotein n=2 Tax=Methylocapsa palsarum TaxID=1612308 RepID=A0A1I3WWK8_9HYPH|nr:putative lipoprotein [Methylocapsa palsarum]